MMAISCAAMFSVSHADVATMNKYYNNPKLAPKIKRCNGNQYCNAFYALSKQWKSIPNGFYVPGCPDCKIKEQARDGDGYGLNKGYSLSRDRSHQLRDAGDDKFYSGSSVSKADERIFGEGLAVLLYLENK